MSRPPPKAMPICPVRRITSPDANGAETRVAPCAFAQVPNVAVLNRGALTPMSRSDSTTRPEQSMPVLEVPPNTYRTPRYRRAAPTRRGPPDPPPPATPVAATPAAVPTDAATPRTPETADPKGVPIGRLSDGLPRTSLRVSIGE